MAPAPPSFGSQEYWNNRFTSNSNPFEWLEAPNALDPYIVDALNKSNDSEPQLLHIGCGTSLLSYHLRAHVNKPEQVHNLDYSHVAIELGRSREDQIFKAEIASSAEGTREVKSSQAAPKSAKKAQSSPTPPSANTSKPSFMRWSSANLLDHASLLQVCHASTYSVVVDKSTSDSIACSDDLYIPLPYHIVASPRLYKLAVTKSSEPLHPLHIMAVHLALVTKPGGRWISLSYSTDRYPFLHLPAPTHTIGVSQPTQDTASMDYASVQADNSAVDKDELIDELSQDEDLDSIPGK